MMNAHARARRPRRSIRALLAAAAIAAAVLTGSVVAAVPANAISSITPPGGFTCNTNRTLSIPYPRIWASYGTEQVGWMNTVERWDPARGVWYHYGQFANFASVNKFGQVVNIQSWVGNGSFPSGSPINNQLFLSISHPGYYRVSSAISGTQGGATFSQYLAGGGHCYLP